MTNTIEIINEAYLENGRWGVNRASVFKDGEYFYFNSGRGDSWACRDLADAEKMFSDFLADEVPAFQPKEWMGKSANAICANDLRMMKGI